MRRPTLVKGTICAGLALAGVVAVISRGSDSSAAAGGLRVVGPTPPSEQIAVVLVLRLPGSAHLQSTLHAIEDPHAASFRHFVAPRAFGSRFGISSARLRGLERRIRASGLRIISGYPQRTELRVGGTASTVERLLRIRLLAYVDPAGRRFHAADRAPTLPPSFAASVAAVTGLDTRPRWQPHDIPMSGLTPPVTATAYDIAALHGANVSGQAEQIAVISFSAFDPADPAAYAHRFGITGPAPRVVPVDGGTTDTSGQDEANLDIDVIRSVAPDAQIVVYEVPQSSSAYADAINEIVAHTNIDIISSSWGQCELALGTGEEQADTQALTTAVAKGVSMFVASGDSGAYDCQANNLADHGLSVDWPAASANAIAVGGTRLYLAQDDTYIRETGWNQPLSAAGGGGGVTTLDARPNWQTGPGVIGAGSGGHRQLPDVSADADPGTAWALYSHGHLGQSGGTSAATPFWAASMLLVEQYAAAHGAKRLGFVAPMLYALAASSQPVPPFHDVTQGGNRYYQARAGWDPATGLGSPDVYNLARDVVSYARAHGG